MESSANEALIIGVNVSIFIIALTIGIMLLNTVLDLADIANEETGKASSGGVMVDGASLEKNIVTGQQLLNYYSNYTDNTAAYQETKDSLYVKIGKADPVNLVTYLAQVNIDKNFLNTKFELDYAGIGKVVWSSDDDKDKEKYVFVNPPTQ